MQTASPQQAQATIDDLLQQIHVCRDHCISAAAEIKDGSLRQLFESLRSELDAMTDELIKHRRELGADDAQREEPSEDEDWTRYQPPVPYGREDQVLKEVESAFKQLKQRFDGTMELLFDDATRKLLRKHREKANIALQRIKGRRSASAADQTWA